MIWDPIFSPDGEHIVTKAEIDGKYYQLTAAIGASTRLIHSTEPNKYAQYLDFINKE